VEQAGESGGPDADGDGPVLAENLGGELLSRHVDHDALAQLQRGEVREVAVERDFVVRAAVGVIENGARHVAAGFLTQIFDAVEY